jgi:hypothetical protein
MFACIKTTFGRADDYFLEKAVALQNGVYARAFRRYGRARRKGFISIELVVILSAVVIVSIALWTTMGDKIKTALGKVVAAVK